MPNIPTPLRESINKISRDMKELGLCIIIMIAFTIYEMLTHGIDKWLLGFKILFVFLPLFVSVLLLLLHSLLHDIGESLKDLDQEEHDKFRWTILLSIHYLAVSFSLVYVNGYIVWRSL